MYSNMYRELKSRVSKRPTERIGELEVMHIQS